ncbi:MAG: zf-HC2 domain-containing protein [Lachnospiraceae bacterium]|nr:zf-HC2 domain-containing protein [Lachnospiraceae bacterium]
MNCKEFEKMIPNFIAKKLDFPTLQEFNDHMETCEHCKEELEIQFLVAESLQRLEEGDAFDLQGELEGRVTETKRKLSFHNGFIKAGLILEILIVAVLICIVSWILM